MSEQKEKNKKKELYMELKTLDDEINKVNSRLENVDEQISEVNSSKETLNSLASLKKGDELRVPLVSGVYIKAALADTKSVLVSVGSNVTVEKSPEEVIEIFDSQLTELSSFREKLIEEIKKHIARIDEIQKEFE